MGLLNRFFGPPGKDKFARLLEDAIRRAGETGEIVYDQQAFRLHDGGNESRIVYLGNAWQEYCSAPESNRKEILKRWARHWFSSRRDIPEDFEDIKPDLLPAVRCRSYSELTRLQLRIEGHEAPLWPHQILTEDLAVSLVYDLPESMAAISQSHLDDWGVTFYEAMEVARQNLHELQHAFMGPKSGEGLCLSVTKDGYDASRLLLLDAICQLPLKGAPIAMVPNRDTLAVAGEDDENALTTMLALAREAMQRLRPISGVALRLDGEEWTPWLPAPEHPLHKEFRLLAIESHGQDYAEQKKLLDKLHEQTGEELFVASYSLCKDSSGRALSYAAWIDGLDTVLPRTDVVFFVREGQASVMAGFDRVLARVGHLMTPLDIYPPRYRVAEFPTDDDLAAMADAST